MKKVLLKLLTIMTVSVFLLSSCKSDTYTPENDIKDNTTVTETGDKAGTADEADNAVAIPPIDEQPEEPVVYVEHRTSFIGCGDNIIYGTKEAKLKAVDGGRELNYKPYYEGVSDIIYNADIAFINQETLMCGDGYALSYYPRFNSPRDLGFDLVELGFDVINIANNHMLDKGADGLSKTIEFWKSFEDTLMIGGYENQEDFDKIRFIEKDGIRIAFLSYAEMTNGLSKPASSELVIPYTNDEDIIRQTELANSEADMVIVSVHWGNEGAFTPNDEQKRLAQLFADCGVDAVIGHHPHVIQPVEWLTGKDGNKTLCVYSLGNFMAQQAYDYNMVGGIISFDIVHSEVTEPYIDDVVFIPTIFHFNSRFVDNNVYLFENYPPEFAPLHGVKNYYGHSISYDRLLGYVTDTIDIEFLPEFFNDKVN